jgi:hypothetical protein
VLLVFFGAVVAARQGEDQRIAALKLAPVPEPVNEAVSLAFPASG